MIVRIGRARRRPVEDEASAAGLWKERIFLAYKGYLRAFI